MPVRIVIDSSAGLPPQVADDLGITVVPLHLLEEEDEKTTAGLSALELAATYARQLERGGDEGVVALHLSKELSSTWSAAITACGIFNNKVTVIDTKSIGMCIGAAAMAAARLAQEGASLKDCVELAEDTLTRSKTWIYLHRIDEIRRSGRISTATAVVSTALATKPIMELVDGRIELAARTRTQVKALSKLTELINQRADNQPVFIAIQQFEAREAARIAIARALVSAEASSLLLLDEPTSALDPATEAALVKDFFAARRDATIVASIHRPSLLPHFDEVILVEAGRVVATGPLGTVRSDSPQLAAFLQQGEEAARTMPRG